MSAESALRLLVVRHAEAHGGGSTDFDRPLSDRGRAQAADVGRKCVELGLAADRALVSAATRAQQTWDTLASAAGWETPADRRRDLYLGDESDVLTGLQELVHQAGVQTAIVVGHNPTMSCLVHLLDDESGDAFLRADLSRRGYPPATLSVLELAGSWADIAPGSARLVSSYTGHG